MSYSTTLLFVTAVAKRVPVNNSQKAQRNRHLAKGNVFQEQPPSTELEGHQPIGHQP